MANTEEKKETYTLFWSGEEISADYLSKYYANELDEIKDKNILLGEFSKNGKYIFNTEMKRALVAIKKRMDDKNDNSYFLVAKTLKNVFTFKMRIFEVENDSLLAANLYLIEVVDDERFKKPLKTFVAQYVDKKNDEFINKAKYIFNIAVEGEFNEFERKENENIMTPVLPKTRERNEAALDVAAENYIEAILQELEKCGEEGKKIKEEFEQATKYSENKQIAKAEKADKEKIPAPRPNYRAIKKKLDSIVEKYKGYENLVEKNPEIKKAVEKYNESVEQEKATSAQAEIMLEDYKKLKEETKKEEPTKASTPAAKKEEKKSGGGGSGGGGKSKGKGGKPSGGGGGKKPDKKTKKEDPPSWKNAVAPNATEVKIKEIDIEKELKGLALKQKQEKPIDKPKTLQKPKLKNPAIITPKIPSKGAKEVVFEDGTKVKRLDAVVFKDDAKIKKLDGFVFEDETKIKQVDGLVFDDGTKMKRFDKFVFEDYTEIRQGKVISKESILFEEIVDVALENDKSKDDRIK